MRREWRRVERKRGGMKSNVEQKEGWIVRSLIVDKAEPLDSIDFA